MITLTACSLINRDVPATTLGHELRLEGEGTLVCSQACQERGQCGTIANQSTVVLGGIFQAQTSSHDVFFPTATRVAINNVTPFWVRQLVDGQQFTINFYNVTAPDGKSGWVAGWCVAAPEGR